MRKDALKTLLKKYPTFRGWVLNKALEEKPFAELSADRDIPFSDVVKFFSQHGFEPTALAKEIARTHKDDNDLFYLFITGKTPREMKEEERCNIFKGTPDVVLDFTLAPMLDAKSIAKLSSCSSALYQRTTSKWSYWRDKFIAKGLNEEVVDKVIRAHVIHNYKKLYRTLLYFQYKFRKRLKVWELFCLSGERLAIELAERDEGLTRDTKGSSFGRNALHYAALSGSVEAMRYAIETLRIPADSRENNGRNALHYAALSGSVEAMRYAIETLHIPADSRENNGRNALHNAAWSGSVEAMRYAIETLRIPADSRENNSRNALHYAALSGSVEAMRYAIETLHIPADSRENNGRNALHNAAWSGSVEAMRYAIETLRIPADSRENNGANALHNAAFSGSVEAMRYAIETLHIPADSRENNGRNALHNAALSGSVEAMRYAIETLRIPADSRENNGANALHYAVLSGSVEAMRYAIETLRIPADSRENNGANALHYAVLSGSVEAMRYAIETLHIPANSRENNGRNALHNAAFSGFVEAIYFVRRLSHQADLKLEPVVRDNNGHDSFWYADQSKNAAAIKDALRLPIEKVLSLLEKRSPEVKAEKKADEPMHDRSKCVVM